MGKPARRKYTDSRKVFSTSFQKTGLAKNAEKCLRPTHSLPQIPSTTL